MQVYGYTQEKETVAVELSVDEIVADGIDPWRLDLFDPQPITKDIEGRTLHFRRIADLSFAYIDGDRTGYIGQLNSADGICMRGRLADDSPKNGSNLRLVEVAQGPLQFSEHFRTYLERLAAKKVPQLEPLLTSQEVLGLRVVTGFDQQGVFAPRTAKAVSLAGTRLTYADAHVRDEDMAMCLTPRLYVGEMFTESQFAVELPDQINWVHKTLSQFSPVVIGDAFRCALSSMPVGRVGFLVAEESGPAIKGLVTQLGARFHETRGADEMFEFVLGDCRYMVIRAKLTGESPLTWLALRGYLTCNHVFSRIPNVVRTTKVALVDIANNQAREICDVNQWLRRFRAHPFVEKKRKNGRNGSKMMALQSSTEYRMTILPVSETLTRQSHEVWSMERLRDGRSILLIFAFCSRTPGYSTHHVWYQLNDAIGRKFQDAN